MSELADVAKTKKIWLGDFVKIHRIGEYAIVEYHPTIFENCRSTGKTDKTKSEYSCYINGKSIGHCATTIDNALAICIAYKYDGINSQAAGYFLRMIGADKLSLIDGGV